VEFKWQYAKNSVWQGDHMWLINVQAVSEEPATSGKFVSMATFILPWELTSWV